MAKKDYKQYWAELKADPVRYAIYLEQQRRKYAKNAEKEHARSRLKYQRTKEAHNARTKKWWAEHPEKAKEYYERKMAEHGDRERATDRAYYAAHKEKYNAKSKDYRENPSTREKFLKALVKSAHREHLSAEQLEQVWEQSRNGPCEICGLMGEVMHLDHCHKKNLFRGVLCNNCNAAIGMLKDDPALLRKAAEYLEKFSAE